MKFFLKGYLWGFCNFFTCLSIYGSDLDDYSDDGSHFSFEEIEKPNQNFNSGDILDDINIQRTFVMVSDIAGDNQPVKPQKKKLESLGNTKKKNDNMSDVTGDANDLLLPKQGKAIVLLGNRKKNQPIYPKEMLRSDQWPLESLLDKEEQLSQWVKAGNLQLLEKAYEEGKNFFVRIDGKKGGAVKHTLLHLAAAIHGRSVIIWFLVKTVGIKVDVMCAKAGNLWTPICVATYRKCPKNISMLKILGASLEVKDLEGRCLSNIANMFCVNGRYATESRRSRTVELITPLLWKKKWIDR